MISPYEELAIEIVVRLLRDGVKIDDAMRVRVLEISRALLRERGAVEVKP